MYLEKILLLEGIPLSELVNSKDKEKLEKVKERISVLENDIKSQPDGRIELKKSGNWFITGFSENISRRISKMVHLKD
jgi:hypothetical protein